jgi:hypothetical protein
LATAWRYQHSAAAVRSQFLDFFIKDKQHTFIRSSPVVPFNDPSLMFVNAGMNQFKSVLQVPVLPGAIKCYRKHVLILIVVTHTHVCHGRHESVPTRSTLRAIQ